MSGCVDCMHFTVGESGSDLLWFQGKDKQFVREANEKGIKKVEGKHGRTLGTSGSTHHSLEQLKTCSVVQ